MQILALYVPAATYNFMLEYPECRLFDPPVDGRRPGRRRSRAMPIPASYVYSPSLVPRPSDWPDHVQVRACWQQQCCIDPKCTQASLDIPCRSACDTMLWVPQHYH